MNEAILPSRILLLAQSDVRYSYRCITALLRQDGWRVNHLRVERLGRQEGLQVPQYQPKRARLWLADGSCVRHRPAYPTHVWSFDCLRDRTHEGRPVKRLVVLEENTRRGLVIELQWRLTSQEVQEVWGRLFVEHGCPTSIRSDHVPGFIAPALWKWYGLLAIAPLFIEPASPWANGYLESFHGKLRDKLLNRHPPVAD